MTRDTVSQLYFLFNDLEEVTEQLQAVRNAYYIDFLPANKGTTYRDCYEVTVELEPDETAAIKEVAEGFLCTKIEELKNKIRDFGGEIE